MLNLISPSPELFDKIITRIRIEERVRSAKRRAILFTLILALSLYALIPAVRSARAAIDTSGFFNFVSLIFSDLQAVMASWQDFALSLLEAIPTLSLTAVLAVIFTTLGSVRYLAGEYKLLYSHKTITNI
ncbi:hypothetical protein A2482_02640 [Candidatus Falkowbacteria bacterium RIFOXYC2_FULL_48_21]|uniref:Uncharacterized protein n=1 Tax=Candidatus Falkowbacteria bacterium RIFOXYC2_FULL_48_21 TaxID=1798005 RepID=A0A1F5TAY3_9BACT|nr:MAG: hypothetical protein A2482_02640 [Candidatus Falkowbacteria bacterium RIFOXYC2_FULL_48_21]